MPLKSSGRRRKEDDPGVRIPALYIQLSLRGSEARWLHLRRKQGPQINFIWSEGFFITKQLQTFTVKKMEESDDEK